jgi:murein DD-endopeptidase MepM/ murein hydrolase activator NlpD
MLVSSALLAGALAIALPGRAQAPAPLALTWPVACQVGTSCQIQHYVDRDPSPATRDYACGNRSYDGHDGVDIRLPDMAAQRRGVAVLAAADGRVLRVRDGVADVSVRQTGVAAVEDHECGNGAVIAHAGGFESQYCHLAKGSVRVKPGEPVKAGQPIGRVGLSGETEFAHLHFTLRRDGQVVDPFAYGAPAGACRGGRSLWRRTPAYAARVVLNTGFAAAPVTLAAVEAGGVAPPGAASAAMVAYVRAIGLKAGDVQALTIRGPDGAVAFQHKADPLPRDQAQRLMFGGRRKPAQGWAKGRYTALYTISAGGKVVLSRRFGVAF